MFNGPDHVVMKALSQEKITHKMSKWMVSHSSGGVTDTEDAIFGT